jgi:hypothetical protein
MTSRDALVVGVRLIGVYWIATAINDFMLGAIRGAGVNLGASSSVERDIIFGAIGTLVGLSLLASAQQIAAIISREEGGHHD